MGRNSMVVSSVVGDIPRLRRVTRLHGQNRSQRLDVDDFSAAFAEVGKLLEGVGGIKVELGVENCGLPSAVLTVTNDDGDTYKLLGMHTMGFYHCFRGDGMSYKMTELMPKAIIRKIKKYFVLD